MHKRIELIFAGLMKCIMQIGQTHSVYVIDADDYDAFAPPTKGANNREQHGPAHHLNARSIN